MKRGTARVDAHAESQCANCGWYTILDASDAAGAFRGSCHRYDYLSTEKTPLVRADDWCFDHQPIREMDCATQKDLPLPSSSH